MSKFHESIREFLEETHVFLQTTLHHEILSTTAIAQKEEILSKLQTIKQDYPQLQLILSTFRNDNHSLSSVPATLYSLSGLPPYVDMCGNSSEKKSSIVIEESYEPCNNEKYEKDNLNESEDNQSVCSHTNCETNVPYLSASNIGDFQKCGYLEKKGKERLKGLIKSSQQRWYALKDEVLYYYDKSTDKFQKGTVSLDGYEARPVMTKDKKSLYTFELVCPGRRTYQFTAPSTEEMQQWIDAIEKNKGSFKLPSATNMSENDNRHSSSKSDDVYELVDEPNGAKEMSSFAAEKADAKTKENLNKSLDYKNMYVGVWDCQSVDKDELSFSRGDVIHILSKEHDTYSWWIGELNGRIGFVPKSYLMEAYKSY